MNISREEQRVLHALAQGARICHTLNAQKKIIRIECFTREGWLLSNCTMAVFRGLKRKRLIASQGGRPYRISRRGLAAVRAQVNNR